MPTNPSSSAPEVLWLPPAWIMANFQPTEGPDWATTRYYFETAHTHLDALTDDIRCHGVRTPVELDSVTQLVRRGHHRLLLSGDVGTAYVPAVFAWLNETTYWSPETRRDVALGPDDFDDWDEEPVGPWVDQHYPIPAAARAVARPVI